VGERLRQQELEAFLGDGDRAELLEMRIGELCIEQRIAAGL